MDPLTIIATTLATANGLGTAFNTCTNLLKTLREKKDPEVQAVVGELTSKTADAFMQVAALKMDLATVQQSLLIDRGKADLLAQRELRGDAYWLRVPPPGYDGGPYCMPCWDKHGTPIHLLLHYQCPICTIRFTNPVAPPTPPKRERREDRDQWQIGRGIRREY